MPLDGDRWARWARVGARRLVGVPVMRWGRVRSVRVVGAEAPTEAFGVICAVRPEGEVGTRDWAARVGLWGAWRWGSEPVARAGVGGGRGRRVVLPVKKL